MEHVLLSVSSAGTPTLVWVGRAGRGRHGGGASAKCGCPLMSALNFWSFCFKTKGRKEPQPQMPALWSARPGCCVTAEKEKKAHSVADSRKSCIFAAQNKSDHGRSKRKGGTVKLGQILLASCTSYCPKAMTTLLQGFVTGRRQICKQIRRVNCCLAFALNRTHSNCIDER